MNPALALEGQVLEGGWQVGELHERPSDATGGVFSTTYLVSKPNSQQGFLKVLNYQPAWESEDVLAATQFLLTTFKAERDLCIACGEQRLSKVVTAIESGEIAASAPGLPPISYIIFELATHDVRTALSQSKAITDVMRLDYLHDVALGLKQLHGIRVAHQDLKPSNFLVFPNEENGRSNGKLADLGRAYREGAPSPIDSEGIPGDRKYAPPEQLYKHTPLDDETRRFAADLYQLGSLVCFIFGTGTMNAQLYSRLDPKHRPAAYGDNFDSVLPYLNEAFEQVLEQLVERFPSNISADLRKLVEYLCNPNPYDRGHPTNRSSKNVPRYSLERFVSQFDLLARREALRLK